MVQLRVTRVMKINRISLSAFWFSLFIVFTTTGCEPAPETNAQARSAPVHPSDDEICQAQAEAKRAELERPYHNIFDGMADAYLGGKLLRVPTRYLISSGSPATPHGPADYGKHLSLTVPINEFERESPTDLDGADGPLYIYLGCAPNAVTPAKLAELANFRFVDSALMGPEGKRRLVPLPKLGLKLYTPSPNNPDAGGYLVPKDTSFSNPQGGEHLIYCISRRKESYPLNCTVNLITNDKFYGWYTFPASRLGQWREIHDFVIKFTHEIVQE